MLSDWLATLLGVPEESAPTIVAAYRIGPASAGRQNYTRDVLVQFLYAKEREAILRMARNVTQVYFRDIKVLFLLDLPSDALLKRKTLKPITDKLKSANIRFKWNNASDVIVVRGGQQHKAFDLDSGRLLLQSLGIVVQSDGD